MAFITIQVPDHKIDYYKQILSEFKEIDIPKDYNSLDSIFTPEFIQLLDDREKEETLSLSEVRARIKEKYAEYGL
jgi:hypothetical protein